MAQGGRGLRFVTVSAILEKAGYRRGEQRHLTRWYALRVLQHESDKDGNLVPCYREGADDEPRTFEEKLRRSLVKRKYPEWLVDDWVEAAMAKRTAVEAQARRRR